ncbi:MAG TPA: hypothetical protein P5060_02315 [Candidatus Absconditabacterales bacterium]|nr:hypothetical protein [Candidatus Absconditabacterales bacterium]
MDRIQRQDENIARAIDFKNATDSTNLSKKHPHGYLPTDLGMAKHFLGDRVKADVYAGLSNPFMETYMKEGQNYNYNHKDIMDALAYMRALSVIRDVDSDVFKKIYLKKKNSVRNEDMTDQEAIKEINDILKNLDADEIEGNKNLQSYLMKCRKSLVSYQVDPNDEKRFTNKDAKDKFKTKINKYSIEDITFNKLSLMILRDYFQAFFEENKKDLGWDNFKVKIANNYDNFMGGSHLIVWFRDTENGEEKNFVLHINTQGANKKMPSEIIPYDYSSSLNTTGKGKPIHMSMKTLDWGNKELFYKFIGNSIDKIKIEGELSKDSVKEAFESAAENHSTEHIKKKIIELLSEKSDIAA